MDNTPFDPITAFDTLYTTNRLQILKILLPHLQKDVQPGIAIYIKLNEFLFSLRFSGQYIPRSEAKSERKEPDIQALVNEISPYLSGNEIEMLRKLTDFKNNMEKFEQISRLMQVMEENGDFPESLLENFLSDEQIAMFKMFQEDLS